MPQKKQLAIAQMKVGILVTIALLVMILMILQLSWGVAWFSTSVKAITYLPDVGGLKPGAPIWLAGIEIGKVRSVNIVPPEIFAGNAPAFRQIDELKHQIEALDPKLPGAKQMLADLQDSIRTKKLEIRIVEVQMDIRSQYLNRISRDSEVSIGSRGLIGDSFIEISPGTFGVLPLRQGNFYLIEGIRTSGFREIMTGANDVIANFGVLSEQIKNIAFKINPDKVGADLGQTLKTMQGTLVQAEATFGRAALLMDDLRKGEGTIGKLVGDPTVYNRLAESLDRFNKIADQIQNGPGTLPRLIKDPALFENAKEMLRKAEVMMDRIEKGEGTIGKLSKDPSLYETSRRAIDRFAALVDQIDKGDGTMGKLLKDPALYNNLNQSSAEITKLIYDLRQDPKKYLTIRFRLF
jgi:phospholipid/cholesterol/gamma-HCH transport system substrate-binding protein